MENKISEILSKHNIEYLDNLDNLKKYFDIDNLDGDKTPKITCEKNVVIICDNIIYNETYLIDFAKHFLSDEYKSNLVKDVKFVYIDNFDVRKQLLAPSKDLDMVTGTDEEDIKHNFEKTFLRPCIFVVNAIENELSMFMENITPFVNKDFESMLTVTKIIQ